MPLANPPVLWDIESDPVLAGTKLIAEAWDAGGLYQVGAFAGDALGGVERPLPRRRARASCEGDAGMVQALADRLLGSPDLYGREPARAGAEHQLRHLPRRLHAERPGLATTASTTRPTARTTATAATTTAAGTAASRGPTDDPEVLSAAHAPDQEPAGASLLLSLGTPMLLMGDEMRRTPAGQQQRLLPGQRDELARLDAARAPRRPAPLRARPDPPALHGANRCAPTTT